MKYCQNCGNVMEDTAVLCGRCGKQADAAVKPTVASGVSNKKPIDIILYGILTFIFFAASLSLIVMAIIGFAKGKKAEGQYVQPSVLTEDSVIGDYVTLDIISSTVCYESYSEKTKATQYVYCIAYDTDGYMLFLKVPNSFYETNLKSLPDILDMNESEEVPENPAVLTLYGTVSSVDQELINYDAKNVANIDKQIDIMASPKKQESSDGWFLLIMSDFLPIYAFYYFGNSYQRRKRLFADYGNYDELCKQAQQNCKYSDGVALTDGYYLFSTSHSANTVRLNDVLCIYQKVNWQGTLGVMTRVNNRELIVINKYGEALQYKYPASHEERLLNTISVLAPLCPRAVVGYTNENLAYIKNNSVKKRGKAK